MKKCFKCDQVKPLESFYQHKRMADGRLNKCIDCTKKDSANTFIKKMSDPNSYDKERARQRQKGRIYKNKPNPISRKKATRKYIDRYPEKAKANWKSQHIKAPSGYHKHHWSYRDEDVTDVIFLTARQHKKAHRFLIYDRTHRLFRTVNDNILLTTRDQHEAYIRERIKIEID